MNHMALVSAPIGEGGGGRANRRERRVRLAPCCGRDYCASADRDAFKARRKRPNTRCAKRDAFLSSRARASSARNRGSLDGTNRARFGEPRSAEGLTDMRYLILVGLVVLAACGIVRQSDLDAWRGMPVDALNTHSLFLTVPMVRSVTASGVEIRNYVNKQNVSRCMSPGVASMQSPAPYLSTAQFATFSACSSESVGCDNIFYIKDGRVLEYRPTGDRCFTDERVRPQPGWERFTQTRAPRS